MTAHTFHPENASTSGREWIVYVHPDHRKPDDMIRQWVLDEHPAARIDDTIEIRENRWLPDGALYVFAGDILTPRIMRPGWSR